MIGIAEMFAELDGYQRYQDSLESWSSWRSESQRESDRWYRKLPHVRRRKVARWRMRYQTDRQFRERWLAGKRRLHRERRGILVVYGPIQADHGTTYGYSTRGCRCDLCRAAQTQYTRDYRARKRAA